jgi:hypothetical protein
MITGCGEVRFLAADPMWDGAGRLPELNQAVAARWPRFRGPEPGWAAPWQAVLSVAYQASRGNAASTAVTERAVIAPRAVQLGLALAANAAALGRLTTCPLVGALSQTPGSTAACGRNYPPGWLRYRQRAGPKNGRRLPSRRRQI